MTITEYRRELETAGYKTKRIKDGQTINYYACKNGKVYLFSISWLGEKSKILIDLNSWKPEIADPIKKAFRI